MDKTDALKDAARAVVAAGKWRWLRGMLDTEDRDVCRVLADGTAEYWPGTGYNEPLPSDALPDLTDPLTAAGAQTIAEIVHDEPTLHLAPASFDRFSDDDPDPQRAPQYWRVERVVNGGTEWLCASGAWVGRDDYYQEEPICAKSKIEALIAAILAAPTAS